MTAHCSDGRPPFTPTAGGSRTLQHDVRIGRRRDHRGRHAATPARTSRSSTSTATSCSPAAVEPHAHLDKAFLAERDRQPDRRPDWGDPCDEADRRLDRRPRHRRTRRAGGSADGGERIRAVRTHADTIVEHGLRSVERPRRGRARVARRDRRRDRGAGRLARHRAAGGRAPRPARRGTRRRRRPGRRLPAPRGRRSRGATEFLLQIATDHRRRRRPAHRRDARSASHGLEILADRVLGGFDLGATASHCVSLGQQPEPTARRRGQGRGGGIGVVALPHTNLFLQGRGVTRCRAGSRRSSRCAQPASPWRRAPTTSRTRSTRSVGRARSRRPR